MKLADVEGLIRPEIRDMSSYHVAESKQMIKLDAMENPYRLPQNIRKKLGDAISELALNRYPDPAATRLLAIIRDHFSVPDSLDLLLGNGSDELIMMLMQTFSGKNRAIMAPSPSFVMYKIMALTTGYEFIDAPLKDDFSLDVELMNSIAKEQKPVLTFLACPNNPTGNNFSKDDIDSIVENSSGLVVIDEAYFPFSDFSYQEYLQDYENVVLIRTVSKMGLAGIRLGYMVGTPAMVEQINKVRLPYNINSMTQAAAEILLENQFSSNYWTGTGNKSNKYSANGLPMKFASMSPDEQDQYLDEVQVFANQVREIMVGRRWLYGKMLKIDCLHLYPTHANFILFKLLKGEAKDLFDHLHSNGILIKYFADKEGALHNCLRVTVGTLEENEAFIEALRTFEP